MNTSSILKAIGGVLLIEVKGEPKLCCLEDMKNTKHFSTGQIFNAIRILNDKSIADYGKVWPVYQNADGDISTDWKTIEAVRQSCESDWDFIVEVCDQLQEDVPEIVERKEVLARLEKFRHGTLQYDTI
ncbi:hypothetical protein [Escherichia coli]|uniref:Uncharacterized protein n=3 Tax=Asteriusvirus PBECO4 TaxID=2560463 RepID=A0A5A4U2Z8_9CAUD|nr:hypothetical protein [Escherichia coli]YP_009150466.1 hypothetical protein ACQ29_gp152 [Escherichia phage PBECO4]AXC36940.1 hypothetical protein [Escherichia phage UB]MED6572914.1 hypothetical protein [Escherichia coli O157]WIL00665.1 hypothetical protein [Escherichia phage vB_EcoM_CRJP21]BBM61977.1 hypothetical protein EO157G_3880 [Escherichia phage SP27]AGC34832.1 hypothetical protein [Escherichia phage PBECO4]